MSKNLDTSQVRFWEPKKAKDRNDFELFRLIIALSFAFFIVAGSAGLFSSLNKSIEENRIIKNKSEEVAFR